MFPPIAVLDGFTRMLLLGIVHTAGVQPGPLKITNELLESNPLPNKMNVVD